MNPETFNPDDYIAEEQEDGIHYYEPSVYPASKVEVGFEPYEDYVEEEETEEDDDDEDEERRAEREKSKEENEDERPESENEPEPGEPGVDPEPTEPLGGAGEGLAEGTGEVGLEGTELAGEGLAEGVELATVGEGVAAAEGGAAVEASGGIIAALVAFFANPVDDIGCGLAILIVVIVAVIALALMGAKPEEAGGGTNTGTNQTVICIDPGHPSDNPGGGTNTGASDPTDKTTEIHMNWLVAKDLETALIAKKYKVVLTKKTESEYVTNKERVDRCAAAGAAFDYRIHMDSATTDPQSPGKPGPWHEVPNPTSYKNISATSKKYADAIQASLAKKLSLSKSGTQPVNGGVTYDTKFLIGSQEASKKNLPVALIEMMTMDHGNVVKLRDNASFRAQFVGAIADGIASVIPTTNAGGGNIQSVLDLACKYVKDNSSFHPLFGKGKDDCWGFVATVLKQTVAPQLNNIGSAIDGPSVLDKTGKFTRIKVTSASQLKPGDALFKSQASSGGHGHAEFYVGKDFCSCSSGVLSSSLGSHLSGPFCHSSWSPIMDIAERLK